jgi:hypothetical protein
MTRTLYFLLFVLVLHVPARAQGDANVEESFGAGITIARTEAVDVSTVIASEGMHEWPVLVEGTIADVCTRKGCWLVVSDGKRQMRVTFKDYAFFVPTDSKDRRVLIEGLVQPTKVDKETADHWASESTIGRVEEATEGDQVVVMMEATGVAFTE